MNLKKHQARAKRMVKKRNIQRASYSRMSKYVAERTSIPTNIEPFLVKRVRSMELGL